MEAWQTRVVEEKKELDIKLARLTLFTEGDQFVRCPDPEQLRLRRQLTVMTEYSAILGERIDAFEV